MQLKTFMAKDMREALSVLRAELGENAVIIASETTKEGTVLVRAAVDETPIDPLPLEPASRPAVKNPRTFEDRYRANLVAKLRAPASTPAENRATNLPFDRASLIRVLHRNRVPDALAPSLAEEAQKSELPDLVLALASALDKRMRTAPIDVRQVNALLLVGCHGSGKTTVAAKLAALARMASRKVRLIATDTVGAGALARIETFGRHLDVEVFAAPTPEEFKETVKRAREQDTLVIADTAAFDARAHECWRDFLGFSGIDGVETIGVVSATMDAEESCEIAQALSQLGIERLVITGLDMARRKGALAALALSGPAVAQVTRSPFLADELEPLTPLGLARALIANAEFADGVTQGNIA